MTLNPEYEHLRQELEQLAHRYDNDGQLLFSGRNQVRLFTINGQPIAVKRFRRLGLLRSAVYRYWRCSKAQRAYDNALQLLKRHIATPAPIAWFGDGRTYYYASAVTDGRPVKGELIEREPYRADMVRPYARFVATLHEKGILHRDLNPTNVLFHTAADGAYTFELIDINRMRFYDDGPVPKSECMENLTLFWWLTDVYRDVLNAYAEARQWTVADVAEAIAVKQSHDRRWVRRKTFTGKIKRLLRKKK